MKTKRRFVWSMILLVLLGVVVVVGYYQRKASLPLYVTEPVIRGNIVERVRVTGRVQAEDIYQLRFEESGVVEEHLVRVGDRIREQQDLVNLETATQMLAVREAEARLQFVDAELARQKAGPTSEQIRVGEEQVRRAQAVVQELLIEKERSIQSASLAASRAEHEIRTAELELQDAEKEAKELERQLQEERNEATVRLQNAQEAFANVSVESTSNQAIAAKEVEQIHAQLTQLRGTSIITIRDALQYTDTVLGISDDVSNADLKASLAMRDTQALNNVQYRFVQVEPLVQQLERASSKTELLMPTLNTVLEMLGELRTVLDATVITPTLSREQLEGYKGKVTTHIQNVQRVQTELITAEQQYILVLARASGVESSTATLATTKRNELRAAEQALERVAASAPLLRAQQMSKVTSLQQRLTDTRLHAKEIATEWEGTLQALEERKRTAEIDVQTKQAELAQIRAVPRVVDLASYEAERVQALVQIERAKDRMSRMTLRSPVAGIVTEIHGKEGEHVQAGTPYVTVHTMTKEIVVDVAETEIARIQEGANVLLTFDALSYTEEFRGIVRRIEPAELVIDGVTYYRVRVQLEKEEPRILSGMTANVEIIAAQREDVLLIPALAVQYEGNRRYVEVLRMGVPERVYVTLGLEGDLFYEVREGVLEGEFIITFRER